MVSNKLSHESSNIIIAMLPELHARNQLKYCALFVGHLRMLSSDVVIENNFLNHNSRDFCL